MNGASTSAPPGVAGDADSRLAQALADRAAGRLEAAAAALVALVTTSLAGHSGAWRALALTLRALGHPEAELCLRRALRDTPADAELGGELAHLLVEAGRNAEALEVSAAVLAAGERGTPILHFARACALYALGDTAASVEAFRRALRLQPDFVSALNNLGVALQDLGRGPEARAVLCRALPLLPGDGRAWNNLGTVLDGDGELAAAYAAYRRAVILRPDDSRAWNNLGGVDMASKHADASLPRRRRALALDPAYADAYTNLGSALQELDRLPEALRQHGRALRLNPRHTAALTARGLCLHILGHPAEAEAAHRRALEIDGRYAPAAANLGALFLQTGRAEEAERFLEAALALNPEGGEAHLNRGLLRLGRGAMAAGWADYAWRFAAKGYVARSEPVPEWRGEPLAGRRLLVWREQGVGDELMFASCYPEAIAAAGHVVIECDPRLVGLFARSFPAATVRADSGGGSANDVDLHAPAGALCAAFRSSLAGYPARRSWLVPGATRVSDWAARLARLGPGLRIGICWRSQLMTTERRSAYTELADWGALLTLPDVVYVNLQYGDCEAEIGGAEERFGVRLHRWADLDLRNDFDGVAALVANLDLVIAPATAVGELAGALGVPVWRLGAADWTWLGTGVRPWYPTMRTWAPRAGERLVDVLRHMAAALQRASMPRDGAASGAAAAGRLAAEAVRRYRDGDLAGAERACREALASGGEPPTVLHLLGLLARRAGTTAAAAGWFRRALKAGADPAGPLAGLAQSLRELDDHAGALAVQRAALAYEPSSSEGTLNLGAGLLATERPAAAERAFRRALALAPGTAAASTNLGNALQALGRLAEAEACHRRAIDRQPELPDAHVNLGMLLRTQGRVADAEAAFRAALAVDAGFAIAHYNLSHVLLERGVLRAGWAEQEWRFGTPQFRTQKRSLPMRAWRGENLAGRRILVWREQGVGDEIMFSSCLGDLIARVGQVVFECDRRLVGLFARSFPKATVRAETPAPTDADVQAPLGGLARHLRPELRRFPTGVGWLVADPARVERWRRRVAALPAGLRVGIAWRSQLLTGERRAAYLELDWLAPLLTLTGVTPVCVQYGPVEDELRAVEGRLGVIIHRWPDLDLKDDFEGTAALMANLDLVVAPATSAGELAAALGVPVWRLDAPGWTQLGSGVRPWFPTMRLFQPRPGEGLREVVARVVQALRACLRGRGPGDGAPRQDGTADLDALLERAVALHAAGRRSEAAPLYAQVLERRPRDPAALHLAGLLAHQEGRPAEGVVRVAHALEAAPDFAVAHGTLGLIRLALGETVAAADALRRALALQPAAAASLTNLGNALAAAGRCEAAALAHRRATLADPALAAAHDNLGVVLLRLGEDAAAASAHVRALAIAPALAGARSNLGMALRRLGRRTEAVAAVRQALALEPDSADAAANLGRLLREVGLPAAADRWAGRALTVVPDLPAALFNRGVLRLAEGRLDEGWAGYDARFRAESIAAAARPVDRPLWQGEDPAGRRLLVWGEQGIGDMLMFGSVLPDIARRAASLIVECDPRLVPLLARSLPAAEIRPAVDGPASDRPEDCDLHSPIGSLPRSLRRSLAEFPAQPGWLRADPVRRSTFAARLAGIGPGLRVGIAWRSALLTGDRQDEYTTLTEWAPVFAVPGLNLVNLQYDGGEDELRAAEVRFAVRVARWPDLDLRNDLDGVAALMAELDLVIAPAISVGELAAALGTPVWRLGLPGDWTRLGTAVRPWFPAMRVFVPRPGEGLAGTLESVAALLRCLAPRPAG